MTPDTTRPAGGDHGLSESEIEKAMDRAASVFGWQHLACYSGKSREWLDTTLRAMVRSALAAHATDAAATDGGLRAAVEERIRRLNPPDDADPVTWHALYQTVLAIVKSEGAPFCSPKRRAEGWRCAAPCADPECVPALDDATPAPTEDRADDAAGERVDLEVVRREAWDEGHRRGLLDAELQDVAENPYRADAVAQPDGADQ